MFSDDIRVAYSIFAYGCVAAACLYCVIRFSRQGLLFLAFSLCTAFPLSNLVLPIGTNIGERLLFSPSVGFCLLVGCVLAWAIRWGSSSSSNNSNSSSNNGKGNSEGTVHCAPVVWAVRACGVLVFACALAAYARRTYTRNPDWDTPEALFKSAYEVCPGSAKVNYILGKQAQGRGEDDAALGYFERAQAEMAPINYCENSIALGVIHIRKRLIEQGIEEITSGLECGYTRKEAFDLLNSAFTDLFRIAPDNPRYYAMWGRVLEKLNRTHDAFSFYQNTAAKFSESVSTAKYKNKVFLMCLLFSLFRIRKKRQSS